MMLVYLPSTIDDLRWIRAYYSSGFPEGASKARAQIKRAEQLLTSKSMIGIALEGGACELHIARTPFSIINRPRPDAIEIVRIWDERQDLKSLDRS
jgi:plasmid stabilization system protein ParE